MSKKPETLFKERIRPKLESLPNTWVEKIQQKCIRGTPDFLCCISGVFVALELKVDAPIEPLQKHKLEKIAMCGGIAIVVTPENWDETYQFLRQIANEAEHYYKQHGVIQ